VRNTHFLAFDFSWLAILSKSFFEVGGLSGSIGTTSISPAATLLLFSSEESDESNARELRSILCVVEVELKV